LPYILAMLSLLLLSASVYGVITKPAPGIVTEKAEKEAHRIYSMQEEHEEAPVNGALVEETPSKEPLTMVKEAKDAGALAKDEGLPPFMPGVPSLGSQAYCACRLSCANTAGGTTCGGCRSGITCSAQCQNECSNSAVCTLRNGECMQVAMWTPPDPYTNPSPAPELTAGLPTPVGTPNPGPAPGGPNPSPNPVPNNIAPNPAYPSPSPGTTPGPTPEPTAASLVEAA